jgi:hypothetical protein
MTGCMAKHTPDYFINHPAIQYYVRPFEKPFIRLSVHYIFQPFYPAISHLRNQSYFKNLMQIKANKILLKRALQQVAHCGVGMTSFGIGACCTAGYNDR